MSNQPLYMNVYQHILASITSGKISENSPLPAERFLCDKYHVSRSTLRLALEKLKEDGYIYTIQGNGTYIKPIVYEQSLDKFYSFTDELKSSNILIRNDIIDYEQTTIDESLADKLKFPRDTIFHKIVRLRSAQDYPLMIETTFLPKNRFIKIDTKILEQGSLYQYLRDVYSFQVNKATENFSPILPSSSEKTLLNILSNTPCFLLERFSQEDDLIIEYTRSVIRGDKYKFRVDFINEI